ncbi:50S ribosomal protein L18e [candidate division MSBL1 archaeon SCGC-AAA259A05]|uniref:Large ribosomal subunit protein eL18 n=1 Tax=candidate division MSBL1 archaeon SCGC-AAA259A05 TaxID=1698259 RepID=A0A133UBB3_9EURY|nr:50S ribosomal protein L18e [candidate division MSBL1 archaeon SCGC-AAA259A05]
MGKRKGPSNPALRRLIRRLRKKNKESEGDIWGELADRLNRSNRSRAEVNIGQLNRYTGKGDSVVVPGKVLGSGRLDHPLSVTAFNFSNQAKKRIEVAEGETLSIEGLLDRNPEGENILLME